MQLLNRHFYAFFLVMLTLFLFPTILFAEDISSYNDIIFFGDSLTDNGNLYRYDFGFLPKSPPYFKGRFSNGNVWSEMVADYYHNSNITSDNYAIGGETAIFHNPMDGFLPYTLTASVDSYYINTSCKDKTHTLYIFWIGANDYLSGNLETDKITSDVVSAIQSNIEGLISHGATNFLILNLPDLSKTPAAVANGRVENLSVLSTLHNTKLDMLISSLQETHKDVNLHLYNISKLFNDLLTTPDVFNNQFNTHIKNTTGTCWAGGYTLKALKNQQTSIEAQLTKEMKAAQNVDVKALTNFILSSPDLAAAYEVGERFSKGETPCVDAGEYVFWDHVHPTATVHFILSSLITDYINQNYHHV